MCEFQTFSSAFGLDTNSAVKATIQVNDVNSGQQGGDTYSETLRLGKPDSNYDLIQNVIIPPTFARTPSADHHSTRGLSPSDVWMAEGNLLVLRGGRLATGPRLQSPKAYRRPKDFASAFVPAPSGILKYKAEKHRGHVGSL